MSEKHEKDYRRKKKEGHVKVYKIGKDVVLAVPKYNEYTGQPEKPEVELVNEESIKVKIADLREQIADLEAILKDAKEAK